MTTEQWLGELLLRWEELRDQGQSSPAAEELCADCPELVEPLKRRIRALERMDGLISPTAESQDASRSLAAAETGTGVKPAPPVLPGYEILDELGRGGMGIVYKARQVRLNRVVALKMVLAGAHARPEDLVRFQAEAEAVAQIQHPHIVQIFEVGQHAGLPFFALEYLEGPSLHDKLEGAPLPAREAARLVETLGRAMQAAHERGIIHRDLKPANVLLDREGRPKVTDFGLAKRVEGGAGLTQTGAIMGTPSYMAPEQAARKSHRIGPAADVYALGAILYELLTGRPPFKAATPLETLYQVVYEEPVPPRRLQSKTPRDVETICLKCLHKEPGKRYASATALADDLKRFLNGEPIEARPVGAWERGVKWARRRPAVAALLALLLVVVVGGFFGMTGLWLGAAAKEREARSEKERADREARAAREAEADTRAFSTFLVDDVLAVARPEGVQRGLGVDVTVARALEAAEPHLATKFAARPLAEAQARHAIGVTWRNLGRYAAAEQHLRRAVDLFGQQLGPDDPQTLNSANSLGVTLGHAGRPAEAIAVLERVRDGRVTTLGADHPDTLVTLNNLAGAYRDAGQTAEAIALFERVRDAQVTSLGADHPLTLVTLNNLANEYRTAGQTAGAIALLERVRDARSTKLGADHPDTLTTLNDLAVTYRAAGQTAEAIALLERVRDAQMRKLGPDHPATLSTLNNLAGAYQAAGQTAEAIAMLEQVRDARVRKLGIDHPKTLTTLNNLAAGYQAAGQTAEAIALFEQVRDAQVGKLGPDHPATLTTLTNLAATYQAAGRLEQALPLFQQAAAGIEKRQFAQGDAGWVVGNLIACHERLKQYEPAEAWRRKWLAVIQKRAGPESVASGEALAGLGWNLLRQQKYAEAEQALREGLALCAKQQPDAWKTFNTRSMLGNALLSQKKYAEAEPLLKEGYEGLKQRAAAIPPQSQAWLAEALQRLVQLYEATGRKDQADVWQKELQALPPSKPATKP
jgi:tetratricopeptide (TPR) repeat protein/tRNA A-37 threonylcarbamoyl transferase component Bud32